MKRELIVGIGFLLILVGISGCLGGDDGDEERGAPDEEMTMNAGANSMSSSKIEFTDHMDANHMVVVSKLDKTQSVEEHVVYLYIFEGAAPPAGSVDLEDIHDTLQENAVEYFRMNWENDEVTWETDIAPKQIDHFTYVVWNPDREEYTNSTPYVYVDIEVYFEENGGGNGDENGDEVSFRQYDVTDFTEYNEDAKALSALEMCELLQTNMGDIIPGGEITAFTTGGYTGTGIDKTTGKCPGWQVYVQRVEEGTTYSTVIHIAENGWCIAMDEHQVMAYPVWDPDNATVDSTDLISKATSNQTTSEWLDEHPNAKLTIQSYHGPPLDSDEESYVMMYKSGEDEWNVYISAVDGRIIESKDPNEWSW